MKNIIAFVTGILFVLLFTTCTKERLNDLSVASGKKAAAGSTQYTVTTLAGAFVPSEDEHDGVGRGASFFEPNGIAVAQNGDLYVADINGNSIRRIVKDSVVSTVQFPTSGVGNQVPFAPFEIAVSTDGYITFTQNGDFRSAPSVISYKPNTDIYKERSSPDGSAFSSVSLDPHFNLVWVCSSQVFTNSYQIYKVDPPKQQLYPKLVAIDNVGQDVSFVAISACLNNIKYLATSKNTLYKFTSDQQLVLIPNIHFDSIMGMAATKDASTIYVADDGYIKRIDVATGTMTTIAGPDGSNTQKDGVGMAADVSAIRVALSNDEKTLYFTNYGFIIRKITLM
ncbi:hypothetical protein SNE25_00550 [Mucilaginibacter sabulilitoris]|uniref:SMP-30/Gluconolactonase/LRE-like region domain-containing protein n=1 Tax=Mucilaginibacter sabulilitoris TaxID=1173583 RepID=A0ABZ0TME2_9SPHI|nr:hypothetical protein [Mucilaginibacter sabulilitoris]WPU94014.1 hypothetical protein SNE25_00550 [Mucilaginibacter sabulilitoris]